MNLTNNYHPVNSKDFLYHTFSSNFYSNTKDDNNNPLSIYLSSNSNASKSKTDYISNNYVKKPLNINITETINNSLNDYKKDNISSIRHYSSFSNHNSYNANSTSMNKFKKTLILDLDETLVHSAFTPFSRKSDIILNINIEGENKTLYVLKRPHVDKFLEELSSLYEIIIFTASISQYANPLLNQLDKKNYIKYRLFREHCTFNNGIYIKDLKIFDRKINNMIIIDNNPLSYDNNIENGIPILSWYDNINDTELLKLLPLLKYMSNPDVLDVRTIINNIVDRSRNEIDYTAINEIISVKSNINIESLSTNNLTIENKYRKNNKSEEPRSKISKNKDFNRIETNYYYNKRNNLSKPLNNENRNNYDNTLFNSKYDPNNNLYNYNIQEKENNPTLNINIDKMDPNGIRKSIFSPEEYNISYTKSLNYSYNTYKYNTNSDYNNKNKYAKSNNEENNLYNNPMKVRKQKDSNQYNNDTYKNIYNYNTLSYKKENETRSLTPNINIRKRNTSTLNNEGYLDQGTITKKISLVELTKKALHLIDDETQDNKNEKDSEYETINNLNKNKTLYKYNNYFSKENELINNDYINNKYFYNYKSSKDVNKGMFNSKYYNHLIEESKNMNEETNSKLNNKMTTTKRIDSFNERFTNADKLLYNSRRELNENNKNKILERINNEKINNFLSNNKTSNNNLLYQTGNNFYSNYNLKNNYNQMNKENYFSTLKKSYIQNRADLNSNSDKFNDKLNYINKTKNIDKLYSNNNQYSLFDKYINKDSSKRITNHNTTNNNKLKLFPLKNMKKFNKKFEPYDLRHLTRSSSYINSGTEFEKLLDRLSSKNDYNKENYSNNINYNIDYGKNLNYKYDLMNSHNKPKYMLDNNKYYNTFNRTNYLKY